MALYYIQTWVIKKGLETKHDSLMESRKEKLNELAGGGRVRYFHTVGGSGNGRVLIVRLNSQEGFMDFYMKTLRDREYIDLQEKWIQLINVQTFNVTFWDKEIPESIENMERREIVKEFTFNS